MKLRLANLALAMIVTACGVVPGATPGTAAPSGPAGSLRAGEFGQHTIDETVTLLAESGIAVYATPDATAPIRQVSEPASPARLLLDQARAMALEAHAGGGIEGAQLDALFEVPPDLAPPSYVLAGYVAAVDTAGARLARSLMGVEDWTAEDWRSAAPTMVYPKLVLILFTSDLARERQAEPTGAALPNLAWQVASAGEVVPPRALNPAADADPCSAVLGFVSGALKAVFDGLKLGDSSAGGSIFRSIWNFVVSVLEVVITTLVTKFAEYVLNWIGRVAAIVGTVATVISAVQPWTASVQAQPTEKGVAGILPPMDGLLVAQITVPANWDWPAWAAGCAARANHPLPNMRPEGTPVTWEAVVQDPSGLVAPGTGETKLDAQGTARLPFTTLVDNVKSPYLKYPGAIIARVTFERESLKTFAQLIQQGLWAELNSVVVEHVRNFLAKELKAIEDHLGKLLTVSTSGPALVWFHVEQPTPPPVSDPPSAEPTDGEFCRRYRDYVAWAEALGPDTDVTQEIAREIATRFEGMHPVAPNELRDEVVLVYAIYATFGRVEEPWNIPGAGHIAGPTGMARLPGALMAMHAYCGIPWPGS